MSKSKINNLALKSDIRDLTNINVKSIEKGSISGYSIEIETIDPVDESTYLYYDDDEARDSDYEELHNLIDN